MEKNDLLATLEEEKLLDLLEEGQDVTSLPEDTLKDPKKLRDWIRENYLEEIIQVYVDLTRSGKEQYRKWGADKLLELASVQVEEQKTHKGSDSVSIPSELLTKVFSGLTHLAGGTIKEEPKDVTESRKQTRKIPENLKELAERKEAGKG